MRVIAIDWSGDLEGARHHIWLAEVIDRRLVRLEKGRNREDMAEHLLQEARRSPSMVVGLDFAFSLPAWFLQERSLLSAHALWALAASEADSWLARCDPPFWGRPGRPRPPDLTDERALRLTERQVPPVGGIRPKSVFQISGAGTVGTGSLRGMRLLHRLSSADFSIWPFDPPGWPRVVEIYPRVLTGPVNKSSPPEMLRHLVDYVERAGVELEASLLDEAVSSEDAFDAALSAFEMARHLDELQSLGPSADPQVLLEGTIWAPKLPDVRDAATPAAGRIVMRGAQPRPAAAARHGRAARPEAFSAAEGAVRAFIDRINAHDPAGLADLMTEDHVFVDALGRRFVGRDEVRRGWTAFFEQFPGYRIDCSELLAAGASVAAFGLVSGGYRHEGRVLPGHRWQVPAAWAAVVAGIRVAQWRVYCDTGWARPPSVER